MITIRPLTSVADMDEAVRLQKIIWGFEEIELLPRRLFIVATKVGGHAFGAFDGPKMVAFVLAIPGMKPGGRTYLHSHMLGVLAEYRNQGLGRLLKLAQREEALARGIELMEWTFDPLEIKNAFFNIERLGAIVSRYVLNQYGTTSSHLHGGLPTDRCVAEWYVGGERVKAVLDGEPLPRASEPVRISVPADIAQIRKHEPHRARDIQAWISEQFLHNFQRGLAVVGFDKTDTAGTYLLAPWPSA